MIYLVAFSLLLGSTLIGLLVAAADNTAFFTGHLTLLLVFTLATVFGLAALIIYQGFVLVRRIRVGVFGAKLTARLFLIVGLMALVPGMVVYGVSVQFLVRSIESWFDVRMERALEGGLALGRSALDYVRREATHSAEGMARQLSDLSPVLQVAQLNQLRESMGVQDVLLYDDSGKLLGFSSSGRSGLLPKPPDRGVLWQVRMQQPWSRLEADDSGGINVHVVLPVNVISLTEHMRILQVIQPVPSQLAQDTQQVESARQGYQELLLSRLGLKRLYGIALTLALTLALFSAFTLAFVLSERLAAPLRVLARGTRAVARGDFSQVTSSHSGDELGQLTQSFNRMTRQLADARAAANESHDQLVMANAYLEGVLSSVTAGVVTLNADLTVRLANPAAAAILAVDREELEGRPLEAWGGAGAELARFAADMARQFRDHPRASWREQVELRTSAGPRSLLARGTPLSSGEQPDYVLVLDDVSQLIRAQRDAAWGEAARRMAHEIKNPLTPIQLSAERLEAKLSDKLEDADRATLAKATATIVGQVAAMKGLVDAFAQYARLPSARIERIDLNVLIEEVLHLYETSLRLKVSLAPELPPVAADPALLRQVVVNLMKNALEATHNVSEPCVCVRSRRLGDRVEFCIEDNGPGFPVELQERLFEPYATTKTKGTGLGLAVVKKIVDEHHGVISVESAENGGARVCVSLPVLEDREDMKNA